MKYFTIAELTRSQEALKHGIENKPTQEVKVALTTLIKNALEPLREEFGKPIKVTSGFRSPVLNKAVGGATHSQHVKGEAADITAIDKRENKLLYEIAKKQGNFDQLIWEYGTDEYPDWVHISYRSKEKNRGQAFRVSVAV